MQTILFPTEDPMANSNASFWWTFFLSPLLLHVYARFMSPPGVALCFLVLISHGRALVYILNLQAIANCSLLFSFITPIFSKRSRARTCTHYSCLVEDMLCVVAMKTGQCRERAKDRHCVRCACTRIKTDNKGHYYNNYSFLLSLPLLRLLCVCMFVWDPAASFRSELTLSPPFRNKME